MTKTAILSFFVEIIIARIDKLQEIGGTNC